MIKGIDVFGSQNADWDPDCKLPAANPDVATELLRRFRTDPALLDEDCIALTILAMGRMAQGRLLAPGKRIDQLSIEQCMFVALRAVLQSLNCPSPQWMFNVPCMNWFEMWVRELDALLRTGWVSSARERDSSLVFHWSYICATCGPKRDLDQMLNAVMSENKRLRLECDRRSASNDLKLFQFWTFGTVDGLYRSRGGEICLSGRRYRDVISRRQDLKRRRHDRTPTLINLKRGDVEDVAEVADPANILEQVHQVDLVEQVKAILDTLMLGTSRGTAYGVALERYIDVRSGRTSARDVAHQSRKSEAAISMALSRIDKKLRERFRIS